MANIYVSDTTLYIPAQRGAIPFIPCHPKTKERAIMRPNGKESVRKVSPEEMEKLWK